MDFKAETLCQTDIASVQLWLATQLEFHKIDAVIYTRHVLDIFLNSRHTNDLHLAEKEASIFAKLPGSKNRKPKQKYTKRNNSFNIADEISLKKEMAVKCLLSAVDKNNDDIVNDLAIKKLIENLCSKLSSLNLLSENKSGSSSDDESSNKKQRSLSLPNKQRENYQDAFPLLFAASAGENAQVEVANSVWGAKNLFSNKPDPKSNDIKEKTEKKAAPITAHTQRKNNTRPRLSRQRQRNKPTADDGTSSANRFQNNKISNKFLQKPAWHHRQHAVNMNDSKPSNTWKQQANRRGKVNQFGRRNSAKMQKHSASETKVVSGPGPTNKPTKLPLRRHVSAPAAQSPSQPFQQGYGVFGFPAPECWQFPLEPKTSERCSEESEPPKLQSKWFRDPQSGFLEFDPGNKSPSNKSPTIEAHSDEVFSDEDPELASESWLWCPSPSLWEDDRSLSPGVEESRLETVYRPSNDSREAGQLWEEYKAIFAEVENDLQRCLEESEELENMDQNLPQQVESILNSIWAEENYFPLEYDDCMQASDVNGNYLPQDRKDFSDEKCVDSECLSCAVFRSSHDGIDLQMLDSAISSDLALLHKQIDMISEDLNSLSKLSEEPSERSRKRIWLRNSHDSDYGSPTKFLCGMKQNRVFSGVTNFTDWEEIDKNGKFCGFYDKSYMMDDFFADVSSTLFGSANLQWLNWSYIDPMMDIDTLMQFQTSSEAAVEDSSDSDEEEMCYVAALVQSVLEFATETEEQNPLMIQLDVAEDIPGNEEDFCVPHPEDQLSSFLPDPRNFPEKSKGLADCITENEAWKTSLRIGNMWQAIAGIRPVDIVYSEKQPPSDPCVLQPTDMTHFRPIHHNDLVDAEKNYVGNTMSLSSTDSFYSDGCCQSCATSFVSKLSPPKRPPTDLYSDTVEHQLKSIEKEIGKLLFDNSSCEETSLNFKKFGPRKLGLDKCQQTGTFERHIQLMDDCIKNELAGRPPKANSR